MAHRIIAQFVIVGTQVLGRAFIEAYKAAAANSARSAAAGGAASKSGQVSEAITRQTGITVDEASKILAVRKGEQVTLESVGKQYEHLFQLNDPQKGGSFYLQSKIFRAKERLEADLAQREAAEAAGAKEASQPPEPPQ